MQEEIKLLHFKKTVGRVIQRIRKSKAGLSINKFALEYDFDKGNPKPITAVLWKEHLALGRTSFEANLVFSIFLSLWFRCNLNSTLSDILIGICL